MLKFGAYGDNPYALLLKLLKEFWLQDLTLENLIFKSLRFSSSSILSEVSI